MKKFALKNIFLLATLAVGCTSSSKTHDEFDQWCKEMRKEQIKQGYENLAKRKAELDADAAIEEVEEAPSKFKELPVDVRTAMIERHPGRFTRVLYAHPNLMRSFPARKVAKIAIGKGRDMALEACAPIITPIVFLYFLIRIANDGPEPEPKDKLENPEETEKQKA